MNAHNPPIKFQIAEQVKVMRQLCVITSAQKEIVKNILTKYAHSEMELNHLTHDLKAGNTIVAEFIGRHPL